MRPPDIVQALGALETYTQFTQRTMCPDGQNTYTGGEVHGTADVACEEGALRPAFRAALRAPLARKGRRASRVVRKGGLEPPRDCSHKLLRLARLPIPPLPRRIGLDSFDDRTRAPQYTNPLDRLARRVIGTGAAPEPRYDGQARMNQRTSGDNLVQRLRRDLVDAALADGGWPYSRRAGASARAHVLGAPRA